MGKAGWAAWAAGALLLAAASGSGAGTGGVRNVLFVIADDLNTDLGCYGHPLVKTPNIDRLAARGVRFERAYCQAPVCNPSRASLFSGLLPETIGVLDNYTGWPEGPRTPPYLPDYFRKQGYFTATVGKVLDHSRVPRQPYWDVEVPEWGKFPRAEQVREQGPPSSNQPSSYWAILDVGDAETADGSVARRAAALLSERAGAEQRFLLAVGFRRPHAPYAAPSRYYDLYPEDRIVVPSAPSRAPVPPAAANGLSFHPERAVKALRGYYASISFMDAQLGLLLDVLDRRDLWRTTVVVFVSDHGYHTGDHGLWHKETLFERVAGVPLVIAAPGGRGGQVCRRVVAMLDLYPTLAGVARLPAPAGLEGRSLVPLLDDPQAPWSRSVLTVESRVDERHERSVTGRSIRTERFRYTEWDEGRLGVELYDHESDRDELANLAADPAHAGAVRDLRGLLRAAGRAR